MTEVPKETVEKESLLEYLTGVKFPKRTETEDHASTGPLGW